MPIPRTQEAGRQAYLVVRETRKAVRAVAEEDRGIQVAALGFHPKQPAGGSAAPGMASYPEESWRPWSAAMRRASKRSR